MFDDTYTLDTQLCYEPLKRIKRNIQSQRGHATQNTIFLGAGILYGIEAFQTDSTRMYISSGMVLVAGLAGIIIDSLKTHHKATKRLKSLE